MEHPFAMSADKSRPNSRQQNPKKRRDWVARSRHSSLDWRHYENRNDDRIDKRGDKRTAVAQGGFKIVGEQRGCSPRDHLRMRFVGIALSALVLVRAKRDDRERKLGLIRATFVTHER